MTKNEEKLIKELEQQYSLIKCLAITTRDGSFIVIFYHTYVHDFAVFAYKLEDGIFRVKYGQWFSNILEAVKKYLLITKKGMLK